MKQAMIIINPSSGKELALEYLRKVEDILREEAGYDVVVNETTKELDATNFCIDACKQEFDLVVSIGGDGTLHETINGLLDQKHRPKLGVVPLGTVNDFARALHIPLDPEQAIHTLTSSRLRRVDMARINDQLFANVVAAGSLADALSSVTSEDKSKFGAFAYFREGAKELLGSSVSPLSITHDGGTWEGDAPIFIAALTNSVGGFENLAPDAEVDDGLLHCFILHDLNFFNTLTAGVSLLLGNLKGHKDVEYFTTKRVSVTSTEPVKTNVDGEPGPALPIELHILPSHVQVIVPEDAEPEDE
ncbi:diacylglycerol/lipid kinase family protein [Saccharibacillus alkalitolerans]|uniref:Diacylglycerol kinase family lipid kinase n=1 Tax=Saccharibacillus alkalitolerans TaxID=2705290 RepID=A0ABX0F7K8_9BACL|nr:diacylglycerol kinase family protein [Saccharibacillus alkalitolerans]NGZ76430.1 diacylglycerol kinase family lipid kinase [Saccharibacillus alkalitolerans]